MSKQPAPPRDASSSPVFEHDAIQRAVSVEEICRACHADTAWIAELVEHGAIEPIGGAAPDWTFESFTLVRVARAKRLQRDLDLTPPAIALVLELLEQIDSLRADLRMHQP